MKKEKFDFQIVEAFCCEAEVLATITHLQKQHQLIIKKIFKLDNHEKQNIKELETDKQFVSEMAVLLSISLESLIFDVPTAD